jgi:hypothetical protein
MKNYHLRRFATLFLMVGVWMTGCVVLSNDHLTRTPEDALGLTTLSLVTNSNVASLSASPLPTGTEEGIVTREMVPTAKLSTTATPTIPPEAMLALNCLNVNSSLANDQSYSGIIILRNQTNEDLLSIEVAQSPSVMGKNGNDRLFDPIVSPSGRLLAYNRVIYDKQGNIVHEELEVVDSGGVIRANLSRQADWIAIPGWLDDNRLVITAANSNRKNSGDAISHLVINPFTKQQETIESSPPDVYDIPPVPKWNGWHVQVYNSALSQIAYLKLTNGIYWAYALWDIKSSQTLASLETFDNERIPVWSPSSQLFVLAGSPIENREWTKNELYTIDRKGAISKLTNLTLYYPNTYIQSYSWSPDGRFIAFWLNNEIQPEQDQWFGTQNLAVLDILTLRVINYCVPGDINTSRFPLVSAPIWSPDSRQLVVENRYDEHASRVILVDITKNYAVQIADNSEPIGWMVPEP